MFRCKRLFWVVPLLAIAACASTKTLIHDPTFQQGLTDLVGSIPGIGPVLAPVVNSLWGVVGAGVSTAGAGIAAGAAATHHYHIGFTKKRKAKLAAKKAATPS